MPSFRFQKAKARASRYARDNPKNDHHYQGEDPSEGEGTFVGLQLNIPAADTPMENKKVLVRQNSGRTVGSQWSMPACTSFESRGGCGPSMHTGSGPALSRSETNESLTSAYSALSTHESSQRKDLVVTVTARKRRGSAIIGLVLSESPCGRVQIDLVKPNGIFAHTALATGMILRSINGVDCRSPSFSVEDAGWLLRESLAYVTIEAILLQGQQPQEEEENKSSTMNKISNWKEAADVTTGIDDTCHTSSDGSTRSIPTTRGKYPLLHTVLHKPTPTAPIGLVIGDRTAKDGRIVPIIISVKRPQGLCADTPLQPGMRIFCIDGENCNSQSDAAALLQQVGAGAVSIVAGPVDHVIAATITKPTPHAKLGMDIRHELDVGLMINGIAPSSLVATTELEPDMRILLVNGASTEHLTTHQVLSIFGDAEERVTIVAERYAQQPPPPGVSTGGHWGTGFTPKRGLFLSCQPRRQNEQQALYRDPNDRVYNGKGQYVGSEATTKFRHVSAAC